MIKSKSSVTKRTQLNILSFLALFIVPMDSMDSWTLISFPKTPIHGMKMPENGLLLKVRKSASPLIFSFKKPRSVSSFHIEAEVKGKVPQIPKTEKQGIGPYDDFVLRFGLIVKGNNKMSWWQRMAAPSWLVEMEKLLPDQHGIKEVKFYTTCQQEGLLNKPRSHPMHDILKEVCLAKLTKTEAFSLKKQFREPLEVLGLWVSTDGDGTGAEFDLLLKKIAISYK